MPEPVVPRLRHSGPRHKPGLSAAAAGVDGAGVTLGMWGRRSSRCGDTNSAALKIGLIICTRRAWYFSNSAKHSY